MLAALMSVGSHYEGIDYDAEILAISNFAAHGAEVIASKVPVATVRLQFLASDV